MNQIVRIGVVFGAAIGLGSITFAQSLEEAVQAELNQMNNPQQRPSRSRNGGPAANRQGQRAQRPQPQRQMRGNRQSPTRINRQQNQSSGSSGRGAEVFVSIPNRAPIFREEALKKIVPSDPASRSLIEVEELVSKPDIPPPRRYTPVLNELPKSFVTRSHARLRGNYDITGLDIGRRASLTEPAQITLNSYILDSTPTGIGRIEEVEIGEKVASIGQTVFVRMEKGGQVGDRYSVVRVKGKIKDPVRGEVGPVVEVGGVLQITGVADESKGMYRAIVLSSVSPITLESILIEEELPKTTFTAAGHLRNIEARVIGGEFDTKRSLLAENATVYLDAGSEAGISVGDLLAVQASRKSRRKNSTVPDWKRTVGVLKVAKVESRVSTAIVVNALDDIRPGDVTGGELPEQPLAIDFFGNESRATTDFDD